MSGEQEGKGAQEDCSAVWLAVLLFFVMGLISSLPLGNHSDSGSFLVVHTLLSQDGFQQEGFWEVVGHVASPCEMNFPKFLPVGSVLLVPRSLSEPPIIKELTQMVPTE